MTAFRNIGTAALLVIFGTAIPAFAQNRPEESKPAQHEDAQPAQHEEQAKPAQHEEPAKPAPKEEQPKAAKQEVAKPETQPAAKPVHHAQAARTQTAAKPAAQDDKATAEKQPAAKAPQPTRAARQTPAAKPARQEQTSAAKTQENSKQVTQQHTASTQQQSRGAAPQRTQEAQQRQHSEPALRLSARGSGRIPDDRFRSNFGSEHVFAIGSPQIEGGYSRFQYGGYNFGFVEAWPSEWYYTDNVYVDFVDGGYYLYNPYYPGSRVMISVVL